MAFKSKIPDNLIMGYCAFGDNHFAVAAVRYCLCHRSWLDVDWLYIQIVHRWCCRAGGAGVLAK